MLWFETALVVLAALTGVIWLLDSLLFARARRARVVAAGATDNARTEPVVVEYARSFFPVILIVLLLRTFVAEPFRIPSSSMMPTLLIGDFILVNKFAYGLRLPITKQKVVEIGEPERGDVVVFRPPHHPDQDWIKRVIGLPGDQIAYRDETLYINGTAIERQPAGIYVGVGSGRDMSGARKFVELLPNQQHPILQRGAIPFFVRGEGSWIVPAGHYFVMGDNRDNSEDSRFWGFMPEQNLVGRAFMIWMSWDGDGSGVDFSRIGDTIR